MKTKRSSKHYSQKMKFTAILLYLFLFCSNFYGQNNIQHLTAFELVSANILYANIDNRIKIVTNHCAASKLRVSTDNGVVVAIEGGIYTIRPEKAGISTIICYIDDIEVERKEYVVIQNLQLGLALMSKHGKYHRLNCETLSKQEFLKSTEVIVLDYNSFYDYGFELVSFKISLFFNGIISDFLSINSFITNEQKEFVSKMKEGDFVFFEDIKVKNSKGAIRYLGDFRFLLVP
jgi:hypothetical protein